LSSLVFPYLSSNLSSTFFGLFVSCFWYKCLIWICCVRSTQIPYTNSIVFLLVYHSVFISRFTESSVSTIMFWLILLMKINLHIRKFWASGFFKIEVLAREKKKNQFKKRNRKKMINITKKVCKSDATTGDSEHWFWKNY